MFTKDRMRFIRFCVVGASGVFVNLGIFTLFQAIVLAQVMPDEDARFLVANFSGVAVSIFTNFLLNDFWTWGDREKHGHAHFWTRLLKFYLVSSVAAAVQVGVAWLVRSHFGMLDQLAVLIGIGVATVINFTANHFWTFQERQESN